MKNVNLWLIVRILGLVVGFFAGGIGWSIQNSLLNAGAFGMIGGLLLVTILRDLNDD